MSRAEKPFFAASYAGEPRCGANPKRDFGTGNLERSSPSRDPEGSHPPLMRFI